MRPVAGRSCYGPFAFLEDVSMIAINEVTGRVPYMPPAGLPEVGEILTTNAKLSKMPDGEEVMVRGVSMAPSKRSGIVNVCLHATAGCIAACVLWFAGRTVTDAVRQAAIARTEMWALFPAVYFARLDRELRKWIGKAKAAGVRIYVRLNTASDIDYAPWFMEQYPAATFYDYTKSYDRALAYGQGLLAFNYHVSFSVSEATTFEQVETLHRLGVNVVVPVSAHYVPTEHQYGYLPEEIVFTGPAGQRLRMPCRDGDKADPRVPEYDGRGVAVGLRGKGTIAARAAGNDREFFRPFTLGDQHFAEFRQKGVCIVRLG
jgi:hypothetical protein